MKQMAQTLARSVSATSRLLDQLVERGLVGRREDEHDRRNKRLFITAAGRRFLRTFERTRAGAQMALMEYLTTEEQALVSHAMALLAEASRRRSHADAKPQHQGLAIRDGR